MAVHLSVHMNASEPSAPPYEDTEECFAVVNLTPERAQNGQDGADAIHTHKYNSTGQHQALDGANGADGQAGGDGTNAGSLDIRLSHGRSSSVILHITTSSGSAEERIEFQFPPPHQRIHILARGADAGNGGSGGNGASGRDSIASARKSSEFAPGDAGNGGDSGRGGDGGRGGDVTISSSDAALFVFFNVFVEGGRGGDAGRAGCAGRPGKGSKRRLAQNGKIGRAGVNGAAGSCLYRVLDEFDEVIEMAHSIFKPVVSFYELHDENEDGIYEPGSELRLSSLRALNLGSLTLPKHCTVGIHSPHLRLVDAPLPFPPLQPQRDQTINDVLRVTLPDLDEDDIVPNSSYSKHVLVQPEVHMSGIALPSFLQQSAAIELSVQFPLSLSVRSQRTFLTHRETATITLLVHNHSAKALGRDECTDVEVHVQTNAGLLFVPLLCCKGASVENPHFARCVVEQIGPHSTVSLQLSARLDAQMATHHFSVSGWSAMLLLRGRRIEEHSRPIRVVPTFSQSPVDVMLVTSLPFSRDEYVHWAALIQRLGLTMAVWDVERYDGLCSKEGVEWLGLVRIVLAFCMQGGLRPHQLAVDHVQAHFAMSENSLVCFGCSERELDHALFQPHHVVASHKTTLRPDALHKPSVGASSIRRAEGLRQRAHRKEPAFTHKAVVEQQLNAPPHAVFFKRSSTRLHETTRVLRSVAPRSAKLLVIDSPVHLYRDEAVNQDKSGRVLYDSSSAFCQALFALLSGMSTVRKLELLACVNNRELAVRLDASHIGLRDIVYLALVQDVRFEFKSKDVSFRQCSELVNQLSADPQRFARHAALLIAALQNNIADCRWKGLLTVPLWGRSLTSKRRQRMKFLRDQIFKAIKRINTNISDAMSQDLKRLRVRVPLSVERQFLSRMQQLWPLNSNRSHHVEVSPAQLSADLCSSFSEYKAA